MKNFILVIIIGIVAMGAGFTVYQKKSVRPEMPTEYEMNSNY